MLRPNGVGVRRLLVVCLVVLFGVPLLAAAPAAFLVKPRVIVYPFSATGSSIDREASARLATIIATTMANTGKVAVVAPPPGTERKDYLAVARANGADYYIAGFISPLGAGVSFVEQVVSTVSGIVVYSNSAQLSTYADAAGQGDDLALFISRHANRNLAAIGTPPPAASPTPAPSGEAQANLGKIFGRRKKGAATPKSTASPAPATSAPAAALVIQPTAASTAAARSTARPAAVPTPPPAPAATTAPATVAVAPASGIAVLAVGGSADPALRNAATDRLVERTRAERAESASAACSNHPNETILSGTLSTRGDAAFGGGSATFELVATNCGGKELWRRSFSNDAGGAQGAQVAMERSVDAAIGAYLNPPKRRRR